MEQPMTTTTAVLIMLNALLYAVSLPILFSRAVGYIVEYSGVEKSLRPSFYVQNIFLMGVLHIATASLFTQLLYIRLALVLSTGV